MPDAVSYWITSAVLLVDGVPRPCVALVFEQPDGYRRAWFFDTPDEAHEAHGVFAAVGHPALEAHGPN